MNITLTLGIVLIVIGIATLFSSTDQKRITRMGVLAGLGNIMILVGGVMVYGILRTVI